jgi:transglutaminase-like putative cysteine protease
MRVSIRHTTRYAYSPPAGRIALRLKLFPASFDSHRIEHWAVTVNGDEAVAMFTNGFGDREAIWTTHEPLEALEICAHGVIETDESAGIMRGFVESSRPGVFLRSTPLTAISPALRALGDSARRDTVLASLHALSEIVHEKVVYMSGSTHAAITAAQALLLGKGVCQDQTHVFVAAARAAGWPARYVVGYLTQGIESQRDTHAWAEAFVPELGWVGFDPANRQCPTQAYVRLASGLDAADAAPIRGCISHGVQAVMSARVEIADALQASQQQSQ